MPTWLSDDEQHLWRSWLTVHRLQQDLFEQQLGRDSELALQDYGVLAHLSEADGGRLRMSEIADFMVMSRSRLTYRIDRLVERGYVQRDDDERDGRGILATITGDGRAKLEAAAPGHAAEVRRRLFDALDPGELELLRPILERMLTANRN